MPLKKSEGTEFEVEFTADDEVLGFHVVPRDRVKNVGLVVDRFGRMPDGSMTPAERHGGICKGDEVITIEHASHGKLSVSSMDFDAAFLELRCEERPLHVCFRRPSAEPAEPAPTAPQPPKPPATAAGANDVLARVRARAQNRANTATATSSSNAEAGQSPTQSAAQADGRGDARTAATEMFDAAVGQSQTSSVDATQDAGLGVLGAVSPQSQQEQSTAGDGNREAQRVAGGYLSPEEIDEAINPAFDEIAQQLNARQAELDEAARTIIQLQEDKAQAEALVRDAQLQAEAQRAELQEAIDTIAQLEEDKNRAETLIKGLQLDVRQESEKLAATVRERDSCQRSLEAAQQSLESERAAHTQELESTRTAAAEEAQRHTEAQSQLRGELSRAVEERISAESAAESRAEQSSSASKQVHAVRRALDASREREQTLRRELSALRQDLQSAADGRRVAEDKVLHTEQALREANNAKEAQAAQLRQVEQERSELNMECRDLRVRVGGAARLEGDALKLALEGDAVQARAESLSAALAAKQREVVLARTAAKQAEAARRQAEAAARDARSEARRQQQENRAELRVLSAAKSGAAQELRSLRAALADARAHDARTRRDEEELRDALAHTQTRLKHLMDLRAVEHERNATRIVELTQQLEVERAAVAAGSRSTRGATARSGVAVRMSPAGGGSASGGGGDTVSLSEAEAEQMAALLDAAGAECEARAAASELTASKLRAVNRTLELKLRRAEEAVAAAAGAGTASPSHRSPVRTVSPSSPHTVSEEAEVQQLLQQLVTDFAAGGVELKFEQVAATQYRFHRSVTDGANDVDSSSHTVLLTASDGALVAHTEDRQRMDILDFLEQYLGNDVEEDEDDYTTSL